MKRVNYTFLLTVFIVFITGCIDSSTKLPYGNKSFDAIDYFEKEAGKLQASKTSITKILYDKRGSDTIQVELPVWKEELKPFFEININKPALLNSYLTDSLMQGNNLVVSYKARDSVVLLRYLEVVFSKDTVQKITAINKTSNMYYKSHDTLQYFGNGNYTITAFSKPKLGKEISFKLTGSTR